MAPSRGSVSSPRTPSGPYSRTGMDGHVRSNTDYAGHTAALPLRGPSRLRPRLDPRSRRAVETSRSATEFDAEPADRERRRYTAAAGLHSLRGAATVPPLSAGSPAGCHPAGRVSKLNAPTRAWPRLWQTRFIAAEVQSWNARRLSRLSISNPKVRGYSGGYRCG